jgi:penicillin V acylase-like amidase (Ntn superfamily)
MTKTLTIILAAAAFLAGAAPGRPCTAFLLAGDGYAVFGKNFDWPVDDGLLVVNKRGVAKVAYTQDNPLTWTSVYGSVTFCQHGREFPLGGMNEAGLAVEALWLDESAYGEPDGRAALGVQQWIQYSLDTCATVAEVTAAQANVRFPHTSTARLHYLVADRGGRCAAFESLNGRMVIHEVAPPGPPVLTNNTYEDSLSHLGEHAGAGAADAALAGRASLDRFARAALRNAAYDPSADGDAVTYAFATLADIAQGEWTKWTIVYDLAAGRVYYRTHTQGDVRYVGLSSFDLAATSPVKILDLNAAGAGDVAALARDYSYEANRALIDAAFTKTEFLTGITEEQREALARYPDVLNGP